MDLLNNERATFNGLYLPKHPQRRAEHQADLARRRILKGKEASQFLEEKKDSNYRDFENLRRPALGRLRKQGNFSGLGGDVFAALPRFYNPREYFEMSQIPYDIKDDKQRIELY